MLILIHSQPGYKGKGQQMTEQTATIINRLLAKAAAILLIASAAILTPPILAGLELLGKG
jgi:hypothetical protein